MPDRCPLCCHRSVTSAGIMPQHQHQPTRLNPAAQPWSAAGAPWRIFTRNSVPFAANSSGAAGQPPPQPLYAPQSIWAAQVGCGSATW